MRQAPVITASMVFLRAIKRSLFRPRSAVCWQKTQLRRLRAFHGRISSQTVGSLQLMFNHCI